MADQWQTYTFEFNGGLITSLAPLQHGIQAPGSARILTNFEPSVTGGYSRIEGYEKYDDEYVPPLGDPLVQGSGQSGTSLVLANIFTSPAVDDTFTIEGVTGTYTIDSISSFDSVAKTATVVLTTALASSPADKAAVTFDNKTSLILGTTVWQDKVVALRGNNLFYSTKTGWNKLNVPSYGTTIVSGGSQTGSTLVVSGLTATPKVGDTFKIAGVEKVYTVVSPVTVTSGSASILISPALSSSPADAASVTWLTANYSNGTKLRFDKYHIAAEDKIAFVDSSNYPFIWDGNTFTWVDGSADVLGASFVTFFKNQLFFAKDNTLYFTAPYTDTDFTAANGAGLISVDGTITGIIVFREALFIFTERNISQLTGNTAADFVLQPVTRNVGCVSADSIQEVGGDVMFLGPEGLRLLSATDRIGDFNLGLVSKPIQNEITKFVNSNSSFASTVIKQKSQYRIFGYNPNTAANSSVSIIGMQKSSQDTSSFEWSQVVGIQAYCVDEEYHNQTEVIVFSNDSGYVYQMESGNSFDGANIHATFATPYVTISDPRIRKTFYKLFLYTDPQGGVDIDVNLKYDFDTSGSIQPPTINVSNASGSITFYGEGNYGSAVYGGKLTKLFLTQVVGSGLSVSLVFSSDDTNAPFTFDAATLEFSTHDRR